VSNIDINSILTAMTDQVYQQFKRAIELQKWPNGQPLSKQQLQTCLQAVIAYEHAHLPPSARTGYLPPKTDACESHDHIHTIEEAIKWADSPDNKR
jgi:uncharacterized protein